MTTASLADVNVPPVLSIFDEDEPRARRSDPLPSHQAADVSASSVKEVKRRILRLFLEHGEMTFHELKLKYFDEQKLQGWPPISNESPRKRCGELVKLGLLVPTDETRPGESSVRIQVLRLAK